MTIPPPHPAVLDAEALARRLTVRFQRRGGPGGQHRNKVSTGVFVTDAATGITAEATESRSQRTNRVAAMRRWRIAAAVALRTEPADAPVHQPVRERLAGTRLNLAVDNEDYAAALALVLDDVASADGRVAEVADGWGVSTGAVVRMVAKTPEALAWVNEVRRTAGHPKLR